MNQELRILLFEDDQDDVLIIRETLDKGGLDFHLEVAESEKDYLSALDSTPFDVILCDHGIAGYSGIAAFEAARRKCPGTPFIVVSGISSEDDAAHKVKNMGAVFVSKQELADLVSTMRSVLSTGVLRAKTALYVPYDKAMEVLVETVQRLSLARSLDAIMEIVRHAARDLSGADGATFVLREGNCCYYAEEDAITPLWKGQRFPVSSCVSGWAMLNRRAAVIADIYSDSRIPADVYRPTFVKSLVMVPIRTSDPIGAIGTYWAETCEPPQNIVKALQALADTTSVAMENVQVYESLERRVKERTSELERSDRKLQDATWKVQAGNEELAYLYHELETFTSAVSHDLRAPLRSISAFSELLDSRFGGRLDEKGRDYLHRVRRSAERMNDLITDLLVLSRATRAPVERSVVNLSGMVRDIISGMRAGAPERRAVFTIADGISGDCDRGLIRTALENLLDNAWKYTSKTADARIEFGTMNHEDGRSVYFIQDNGAGFDMQYAEKLFVPFQRLHSTNDFPGTGVGLATVQRIIRKHGGLVWAKAAVGAGATFYFTLG